MIKKKIRQKLKLISFEGRAKSKATYVNDEMAPTKQ